MKRFLILGLIVGLASPAAAQPAQLCLMPDGKSVGCVGIVQTWMRTRPWPKCRPDETLVILAPSTPMCAKSIREPDPQ